MRKLNKRKSKPSKLRCFVGIRFTLHAQITALLSDLATCAEDETSKLRIAPPENLHITLKFLGSVPEAQLPTVQSLLKQLVIKHRPFDLSCAGIGFFKNSIWIGVESNKYLNSIASDADQAFSELGFGAEPKPYVPHITIARFGKNAKIKLSALQEKYKVKSWGTIKADKIQLYKSDTLPEGARYTILENYTLEDSS